MPKHHLPLKNHLNEQRAFTRRAIVVFALILLLGIALITRLFFLQIVEHKRYTTLSDQNQLNVIPISPNRGLIYDRHGVLLAQNVPVFSLELTPDRVKNIKKSIAGLKKIIDITPDNIKFFNKQLRQHRRFDPIPLKVKLTPEEVAKLSVNLYKFPGVAVNARLIRHYPLGKIFAHVLGYVGRINEKELKHVNPANYAATNFIGKIGIERYYEDMLHGQVGFEQVETDASGRVVRVIKSTPPVAGRNIHLTVDSGLEQAALEAMGDIKGAVVAIDPSNGEVLALVSNPSYDPNLFVQGISTKDFKALNNSKYRPLYNRAIRGQYPLASTIKPFLALGALDDGVINKRFSISDPGWFKLPFSSHIYKDWRKTGHGRVNVQKAIIVSCDTFYYTVAYMMGITRIDSILTKFGFGVKTGIDMLEELPGLVPSPAWKYRKIGEKWYPGDTVISGIGQGFVLTTPIQLAQGGAALAEHGKRYQAHLLQKSVDENGQEFFPKAKIHYPVMLKHPSNWDFVINAMRLVIKGWNGTAGGRFGRDAPYSAAAKTGTAQVFSAKNHQHLKNHNLPEHLRDHSLFVVFAPIENPQIAVAVVAENSKKAPVIARKVLDYYLLIEKNWSPHGDEGRHTTPHMAPEHDVRDDALTDYE